MNDDWTEYTWGGVFGCFLLALGLYGFFFGLVFAIVGIGKLL